MKKFLSLALAMLMVLSMSAMLFACDTDDTSADTSADTSDTQAVTEGVTAVPHTCAFDETKWASDESNHWHPCTTENCNARDKDAIHNFGAAVVEQTAELIRRTYTCQVCEYKQVQEVTISAVVNNQASWADAFENLKFLNFSAEVSYTYDGDSQHNKVAIDEDTAYYVIQNTVEYYSTKNEDGTWTTYMRTEKLDTEFEGWVKLEDKTSQYYDGAATEVIIQISFADHYEKFKYDAEKGAYTCADVILAKALDQNGEVFFDKMNCYNNVIKVADGKITTIEMNYYMGDEKIEGETAKLAYFNIGLTEVIVPQAIVDNAPVGTIEDNYWGSGNSGGNVSDKEEHGNKVEVTNPDNEADIGGAEKLPEKEEAEEAQTSVGVTIKPSVDENNDGIPDDIVVVVPGDGHDEIISQLPELETDENGNIIGAITLRPGNGGNLMPDDQYNEVEAVTAVISQISPEA